MQWQKGCGLIFIISAPSGTGKTTLVRRVVEELADLQFSVSYTTRQPRLNEREGGDYHFVSPAAFQEMVDRGQFLEWAEVLGNRYGTTLKDVETLRSEGVDLILDIDTQGARRVLDKLDRTVSIYVLPPSLRSLRERLVSRGLDSLEMIEYRLAHARKDMEEAHGYDYVIVNEMIDDAAETLKAIVVAERCRKGKNKVLKERMKEWEKEDGKNHG